VDPESGQEKRGGAVYAMKRRKKPPWEFSGKLHRKKKTGAATGHIGNPWKNQRSKRLLKEKRLGR